MRIKMSPCHYFAIFLFSINAAAATVDSIKNQQEFPPVDFFLTLNVTGLTDTSYQTFITDLRNQAKDVSQGRVPILPSYDKTPHLFGVILLATDDRGVTYKVAVLFRRDNLNVRGYLMKTDQWMELREDKSDDSNMIKSFKPLKFFGSYPAMVAAAQRSIENTKFDNVALQDAVFKLANSAEQKDQARSLIFMALMISEAARFKDVSSFFGKQLVKGKTFPNWMMPDLLTNWSQFSRAVQCYEEWKEYKFKEVKINGVTYKTVDQLGSILGVMLKQKNLSKDKCGIKKLADVDEDEAAVVLFADM